MPKKLVGYDRNDRVEITGMIAYGDNKFNIKILTNK